MRRDSRLARLFDRNMFIMLLAVMLGAIIITFFLADIIRQSEFDVERKSYIQEIEDVTTEKNIFENQSRNFTDNFFKSLSSLDLSREYRAEANSYFDFAASIWFPQKDYIKTIENCTSAMESYIFAYDNFLNTASFFNTTKNYSSEIKYSSIIDLYIGLSKSGASISMIRYNASKYLRSIAENLSLYGEGTNVSELLVLFNETNDLYDQEIGGYNDLVDEIENEFFKYFNPNRET